MEQEPAQVMEGDQPPAQVEGEAVQPPAEALSDELAVMEEKKSVKEMDTEAGAVRAAVSTEDLPKPGGVDPKEDEEKDDMVMASGDEVKVVAVADDVRNESEGGKGTEAEADKLENGDRHVKGSSPIGDDHSNGGKKEHQLEVTHVKLEGDRREVEAPSKSSNNSFMFDYKKGGDDSGTEEEQAAFMKELERFHREKCLEFKTPKFYGEGLNCLKLWRQVTGLGGYDQVTSGKLWRQVGESFKPPKTCTTVSWTFRNFYEKALIEYEKYKVETGEFHVAASTLTERIAAENQMAGTPASGSGRARRESATRAMQGWHSQRLLGNGEIADPIIKDKGSVSVIKKDKNSKSSGSAKRKRTPTLDDDRIPSKSDRLQSDSMVIDMGPPADWVKINVRRTKDCYEVYALVPGLLREEVLVQSDPAGRLIVTGEPEQPDNPWGVTPFKKEISLPSRIDPHQTSAVVTLHGQLFVRAPFEQSKS